MFFNHPAVWIVVGLLATWRITSIIQTEGIFSWFRRKLGVQEFSDDPDYWIYPENFIGSLLRCFWCGSVWVGLVVSAVVLIYPLVLLPFALSAGAIAIKIWIEEDPNLSINIVGQDTTDEDSY